MEEGWDNNGPYALAKLADRLVPIPRDDEPQVSLYALCRAWVRNNPTLPLAAEVPTPQQTHPSDAAARDGGAAGPSLNGDAAKAGPSQPLEGIGAPAPAVAAAASASSPEPPPAPQPPQEPQPHPDAQTSARTPTPAPPAQPQTEPAQPLAPPQDAGPNGLISILPPVLPPTALETSTAPPSYPLDDFEAVEPEEALRKFKDHWVSVRQYHQALRAAKLSRHRERLLVLLGEPSLLAPLSGLPQGMPLAGVPLPMQVAMQMQIDAAVASAQQQPGNGMQLLGPDGQPLTAAATNGVLQAGLVFQGGAVGPLGQGLPPDMAGFAVAPAGGPTAAPVSAADAQAALAAIMNLVPAGAAATGLAAVDPSGQRQQLVGEGEVGLPGAAQLLQLGVGQPPPPQQQLFLQQQLGLLAGGGPAAAGQVAMLPPIELLQALQQQQQQPLPLQRQPAAAAAPQPAAVLGQLSAAMATAAANAAQGQLQGPGGQELADATGAAGNGNGVASAPEPRDPVVTAPARAEEEAQQQAPEPQQGTDGMDVDSGPPPGS